MDVSRDSVLPLTSADGGSCGEANLWLSTSWRWVCLGLDMGVCWDLGLGAQYGADKSDL